MYLLHIWEFQLKQWKPWEGGRTHPTGPVFRLLDILSESDEMEYIVAK